MHILFEDTGKFLAGRVLSEADTSAQVELDSGKRVKVKTANISLCNCGFQPQFPTKAAGCRFSECHV